MEKSRAELQEAELEDDGDGRAVITIRPGLFSSLSVPAESTALDIVTAYVGDMFTHQGEIYRRWDKRRFEAELFQEVADQFHEWVWGPKPE